MSEEDSQTLPGGVTPEKLACFRLVVLEELAKREVGKSQAVAGAGGDSLQDPERTIPGEWWALYGRSMVVAS